jgi:hypothetical protein
MRVVASIIKSTVKIAFGRKAMIRLSKSTLIQ